MEKISTLKTGGEYYTNMSYGNSSQEENFNTAKEYFIDFLLLIFGLFIVFVLTHIKT